MLLQKVVLVLLLDHLRSHPLGTHWLLNLLVHHLYLMLLLEILLLGGRWHSFGALWPYSTIAHPVLNLIRLEGINGRLVELTCRVKWLRVEMSRCDWLLLGLHVRLGLDMGSLSVLVSVILLSNHESRISDFISLQLVVFTLSLFILHIYELVTGVLLELLVLILGH